MIEVVELDRLKEAVAERGTSAYVLTVSGTATPHVVQAAVRWTEGRLAAEVGATTARNATARPGVSVLYPARSPVDHSLIIDGTARGRVGQGASSLAGDAHPGRPSPRRPLARSDLVLHGRLRPAPADRPARHTLKRSDGRGAAG